MATGAAGMKPIIRRFFAVAAGAAILSLVPGVLAHGDEDGAMDMGHGGGDPAPKPSEDSYPATYFALEEHRGVLFTHIALMVLGWVLVLPVAVMLSLARSRYTVATQLVFALANGAGVFFGIIYNSSTPDLYPNNAHHKLGWIVTWVTLAQFVVGLLGRLAGAFSRSSKTRSSRHLAGETHAFMPVSTEAMAEHQRGLMRGNGGAHAPSATRGPYRFSDDSGHGTESMRSSHSSSSRDEEAAIPLRAARKEQELDDHHDVEDDSEADEFLGAGGASAGGRRGGRVLELAKTAAGLIRSPRAWKVLVFGYNFVDRVILILGFITLSLGIITMGRFFEGQEIFSGLAHWIKGGVFFWLGIFTLGRWCGAFGELGWAWNVRPRTGAAGEKQKWRPTAEFAESFLIFFYGSTNIFLEHLGGWGGAWTAQDLEHISITVLFIGGGLAGMLVESTRIRDLLNASILDAAVAESGQEHDSMHSAGVARSRTPEEEEALRPPRQYGVSLNPLPALVILLVGIMMSSHTQHNMVSSMVHKQWGNLLAGGAFARGFSYVLMYLKPPRSVLPSRPPTELLTAFGLMAGGIIFMASASDTVSGMIHYDLDAMFMYTVTMGLIGLIMAWVVVLMALKGWAVRREAVRRAPGSYRHSG